MHFSLFTHNPIILIPIFYFTSIVGLSNINKKKKYNSETLTLIILISSILTTIHFGRFNISEVNKFQSSGKIVGKKIYDYIRTLIPKGGSVSVPNEAVPMFTEYKNLYSFSQLNGGLDDIVRNNKNYVLGDNADFIVLDIPYTYLRNLPSSITKRNAIQKLVYEKGYGIEYFEGGIYLLKKGKDKPDNKNLSTYFFIYEQYMTSNVEYRRDEELKGKYGIVPKNQDERDQMICLGPYIDLDTGSYSVKLEYKILKSDFTNSKLDFLIKSSSSNKVILSDRISLFDKKTNIVLYQEFNFRLNEKEEKVEIIPTIIGKSQIEMSYYQILKNGIPISPI
jgi:hypothetical protein